MKVMQEHIDFPLRTAVKVKWQKKLHFTYPWHFHSEFEILYVIEGSGTSFVADSVEPFQSGDLAIMGSNLPHFWRSDEKYHAEESKEKINYIVIQFQAELFRESILDYPEFHLLKQFFSKASRGIRFLPAFSLKAGKQIVKIAQSSGIERVVALVLLLDSMSKTDQYRVLAGELYQQQSHNFTDDRLTKVLHYINTCYQQKIDLNKVADIANLHPSAFCRFFKEKTGKSLSEYLADMRISYACKLLTEGKLAVSQICFESGFNNLSNFNRTFKKQTKLTPTEYYQHFHLVMHPEKVSVLE
jgi:AraC-like DNA-binding protein/mannose-6-phosphate isomerase-like protein (cupin superfamily)